MSAQDGGPAFPRQVVKDGDQLWTTADKVLDDVAGMSLRDYFAGRALAAMDLQINIAEPAAAYMAKSAYLVADAMLKARAS